VLLVSAGHGVHHDRVHLASARQPRRQHLRPAAGPARAGLRMGADYALEVVWFVLLAAAILLKYQAAIF
jgi:hypothetical protein